MLRILKLYSTQRVFVVRFAFVVGFVVLFSVEHRWFAVFSCFTLPFFAISLLMRTDFLCFYPTKVKNQQNHHFRDQHRVCAETRASARKSNLCFSSCSFQAQTVGFFVVSAFSYLYVRCARCYFIAAVVVSSLISNRSLCVVYEYDEINGSTHRKYNILESNQFFFCNEPFNCWPFGSIATE